MNLTCLKSGIWQVELGIPFDVRVLLGRTTCAKPTGTRELCRLRVTNGRIGSNLTSKQV